MALLGTFVPKTAAELFGTAALVVHLCAYTLYALDVFRSTIRPNLISWLMWLFGGLVEFFTYNAIESSHWSTSALPLACVLGIGMICVVTSIAQFRSSKAAAGLVFLPPERVDYFMVGFDVTALLGWVIGLGAAIANFFAVSTSIVTFIPIWRTTWKDPTGERPLPWALWSLAYAFMFFAVACGEGAWNAELYFYPVYYFILHVVMVFLSMRRT